MADFLVGYDRWNDTHGEIPIIQKRTGTYNEPEHVTRFPNFTDPELNRLGAIPVVNFFSGIAKVCDAFRMNFKDDLDEPNYYTDLNMLRYRVTQFSIGILEITLVGGWIVHGIATAYFYVNRDAP